MNTKESLIKDLKDIGLEHGDMVFLRISYKSLGETEGGPQTFIDALLSVVGDEGTILAAAFSKRYRTFFRFFNGDKIYKKEDTKPVTGIIPVFMVNNPNAEISEHPISPYVAIGHDAKEIIAYHTPEKDSYDIVGYMLKNYHPKCLRIGGDVLDGTTHLAFSKALTKSKQYQRRISYGMYYMNTEGKKKWKVRTVSAFCRKGFEKFFYKYLYRDVVIREGRIGTGEAMLTDMRLSHELEEKFIGSEPWILSCQDKDCIRCRVSFSYSDTSFLRFFTRQFLKLFLHDRKKALRRLKETLETYFIGCKCQ